MWQEGGSIWVWEPKGQQEVFVLLIQINFFTSGLWILITSSWQQPKWNCSTALLSALVLLPRQLLWLFFKDGRSGVLKAPWRAGTVPLNALPPRNNPYQKPIIFYHFSISFPLPPPRGCSFQTHPDIPEEFRPEQFHPALCTGGKYSSLQPQYSMPRLLGQFHMAHDSRLLFAPQHHSVIITAQEHWNPRNTRLF